MATRTVATKKTTAKKTENTAPVTKRSVGRPRKIQAVPEVVEEQKTTRKRVPKEAPAVKPSLEIRAASQGNTNLLDSEKDKNKKIQGLTYAKVSELIGVGIGTEQFLVAIELLKGGNTRNEINERLKELLPTHTQTGSLKQVTNLVSGVHNRMLDAGFQIKGTYQLVKPPTAK